MIHRRFILLALLAGLMLTPTPVGAMAPRPYHEGQIERGDASWYGGDWQGTKTASGERFDKMSLTGAHRRLPFGSIVRVTNRLNGLTVEVRINDRGPWKKSRIIDVSEAAAEILKMKSAGTVPVEILVLRIGAPAPPKQK